MNLIFNGYYFLRLVPYLGLKKLIYMAWYKFSLKSGFKKMFFPIGQPIEGIFFQSSKKVSDYPHQWASSLEIKLSQLQKGNFLFFQRHLHQVSNPPQWFLNPFENKIHQGSNQHWTILNDFNKSDGDIKIYWELSRFNWVTDLTRGYLVTQDEGYLKMLNTWLEDWSKHNPLNVGPNWKCGQEAAFRVMKLITSTHLLNKDSQPAIPLIKLIEDHLIRIKKNIHYSIVQDNNHGTSESAALYIGACWLLKYSGKDEKRLNKWKRKGRNLLEERIKTLIYPEGTFAQRSVNYHRVVMDTLSWVLFFMNDFGEPSFKPEIEKILASLGYWLYVITDKDSGNAPNIGANDGAMIEQLHGAHYRDFRPCIQLFFGMLKKVRVYKPGLADETLFWYLGEEYKLIPFEALDTKPFHVFDEQFIMISNGNCKLFLKVPENTFRPLNDPLHLEIWYNGEPRVISCGTYSYNAGELTKQFKSISASNTIRFGNNESMPILGPFLYGEWITSNFVMPVKVENDTISVKVSYTDYEKNKHIRFILVQKDKVIIKDKFVSQKEAEIHWHLNAPIGKIKFENNNLVFDSTSLTIENVTDILYKESYHSLYYLECQTHAHVKATSKGEFITSVFDF